MTDAKRKLIDKIKALLAKTMENGCTEHEALAALALARRLMTENDVGEDDIAFGGEQVAEETRVKVDHDEIRDKLVNGVAKFCGCAGYGRRKAHGYVSFVGLQSEAIFAHWLLDTLAAFVEREIAKYAASFGGRRITRIERVSFVIGCAGRIAARLIDLAPKQPKGSGRDLVLARSALINKFMVDNAIKLREPFRLYDKADEAALAAGTEAGNRAQFNKPIDGETEVRRINGRS